MRGLGVSMDVERKTRKIKRKIARFKRSQNRRCGRVPLIELSSAVSAFLPILLFFLFVCLMEETLRLYGLG